VVGLVVVRFGTSLLRRLVAGGLLAVRREEDVPYAAVDVATDERTGSVVVLFPVLSVRHLAPRRS
jgi:hypothetical protein